MRTLDQLVTEAKEIEASTDANLGGAIIQVTNLSVDECAEILMATTSNKKGMSKKIARVRDEKSKLNVEDLRHSLYMIIQNNIMRG